MFRGDLRRIAATLNKPLKSRGFPLPTFRDLLADGRVHVFDGAMGTMLYGKGFFLNVCYGALNPKRSRSVQEVHLECLPAGAELLRTCPFGVNPEDLNSYGL